MLFLDILDILIVFLRLFFCLTSFFFFRNFVCCTSVFVFFVLLDIFVTLLVFRCFTSLLQFFSSVFTLF